MKYFIILTALLMTACTNNMQTADQVINQYLEARGGYESIKNIQSKIYTGHYIEPGYNLLLEAQIHQKRPYYRLVGDPETGFAEGFDGSSWEYFSDRGVIRSEGEAEAATRRGSEFDESLIDYKEKGHDVEFKGIRNLNGEEVYELELIYNDGWVKTYFIDTSSNLITAMRKAMPLHARGDDIDYLVTITDYRKVGEVLFPFTHIEREYHTNKMISTTMWDTLILNKEIPDSLFSPPLFSN